MYVHECGLDTIQTFDERRRVSAAVGHRHENRRGHGVEPGMCHPLTTVATSTQAPSPHVILKDRFLWTRSFLVMLEAGVGGGGGRDVGGDGSRGGSSDGGGGREMWRRL